MGRPKGQPKLGGRQKGTQNKKTLAIKELKEICEDQGFNPFKILADLCLHHDPAIQLAAVKEACQYIAPKKRAIEVTGLDGGPIQHEDINRLDLEATRSEIEAMLVKTGRK